MSASVVNALQRFRMLALYQAPGVCEIVGLAALEGSILSSWIEADVRNVGGTQKCFTVFQKNKVYCLSLSNYRTRITRS